MRISLAQIASNKGEIEKNIDHHIKWIKIAIAEKADLILFPELSLLGYEPKLAGEFASDIHDLRLDVFQEWSDKGKISIGLGLPTKAMDGILISMFVFQPGVTRQIYSKQMLHDDEKPYFIEGSDELLLTINGKKMGLAICYESLQSEHAAKAKTLGADFYLASVAKSQKGIDKANAHFPEMAKKHNIPVLMSNCIGFCDDFLSVGQSSVWDENGVLIGQLDHQSEGLLLYDSVENSCVALLS